MDTKKLVKKIAKLMMALKGSDKNDLKIRVLRKLLKRAQRRVKGLKVKAEMVAAKATKKAAKEEAA